MADAGPHVGSMSMPATLNAADMGERIAANPDVENAALDHWFMFHSRDMTHPPLG